MQDETPKPDPEPIDDPVDEAQEEAKQADTRPQVERHAGDVRSGVAPTPPRP